MRLIDHNFPPEQETFHPYSPCIIVVHHCIICVNVTNAEYAPSTIRNIYLGKRCNYIRLEIG